MFHFKERTVQSTNKMQKNYWMNLSKNLFSIYCRDGNFKPVTESDIPNNGNSLDNLRWKNKMCKFISDFLKIKFINLLSKNYDTTIYSRGFLGPPYQDQDSNWSVCEVS